MSSEGPLTYQPWWGPFIHHSRFWLKWTVLQISWGNK